MAKKKIAEYVQLANNILSDTEVILTKHADDEGAFLIDKAAIKELTNVIQEGLVLNNYIVEHKLYTDNAHIQDLLGKIAKESDKLVISDENAKKLNFRDAIIDWGKIHGLIVALAMAVVTVEEKNA